VEQVIPEHEKIADAEFQNFEKKLKSQKGESDDENDPIMKNIRPKPD